MRLMRQLELAWPQLSGKMLDDICVGLRDKAGCGCRDCAAGGFHLARIKYRRPNDGGGGEKEQTVQAEGSQGTRVWLKLSKGSGLGL